MWQPTGNYVGTHWQPATIWQPIGKNQLCGNPLATGNYVATHWQPATMWQPTGNHQ